MSKELVSVLIPRTVWIVKGAIEGFEAINSKGEVVERAKHQSTLNFILRQRAADKADEIYAIAVVVSPNKRIPDRRLNKR